MSINPAADASTLTVLTWNLQGSKGLDVPAVAAIIAAARPDAVALQEIQRQQTKLLAERLAMTFGTRWVFKHWPIVTRAEGLAVLTPHRLLASRALVIRRHAFWNWKRRVVVLATIHTVAGELYLADVHLSPHDALHRRSQEAQAVVDQLVGRSPSFVVGDLNDIPGDGAYRTIVEAGYRDAWGVTADRAAGDETAGATNWTAGARAGRPPTQRIDYVFVPGGWEVLEVEVGVGADIDRFAELSDHLPLVVTARAGGGDR